MLSLARIRRRPRREADYPRFEAESRIAVVARVGEVGEERREPTGTHPVRVRSPRADSDRRAFALRGLALARSRDCRMRCGGAKVVAVPTPCVVGDAVQPGNAFGSLCYAR